MVGIYKITSPSGRIYIGLSYNIEQRWRAHRSGASRCHTLKNSFKKYGFENHQLSVLHELPEDVSEEIICEYEMLYIHLYKECGVKMANQKMGGQKGGKGNVLSKEQREAIGKRSKGNTYRRGVKLSQETIEKMKKALKGRKVWNEGKHLHEETKKKLSDFNKGKKLSEETKRKISEATKGVPKSETMKLKLGAAHKGKIISLEQRQVLREANLGKKHSRETKLKMSKSRSLYLKNKKCQPQPQLFQN